MRAVRALDVATGKMRRRVALSEAARNMVEWSD